MQRQYEILFEKNYGLNEWLKNLICFLLSWNFNSWIQLLFLIKLQLNYDNTRFIDDQIKVISWWMLQSKTLNLYKSTFFDRSSTSQSYNRHQHLYQHYYLAHCISPLTFQLLGQLQWLNYFSEAWLKAEYDAKSDYSR